VKKIMRKRSAITPLAIAILLSVNVAAPQTKNIPRIGWLSVRHGPTVNSHFVDALAELGWTVGENITIEARFAEERYDRLPRLAAELVQLKVDVIVAADSLVISAAKNATRTIPIVMGVVGDSVSLGYVRSVARPGGNITGIANIMGLTGKRLEILKEVVPGVSHVAVLAPTKNLVDWKKIEAVSRALGVQLYDLRLEHPDTLESAFRAIRTIRANGLLVVASPQTNFRHHEIIKFATRYQLPAVYPLPIYAGDGGLMSYGPDLTIMRRRAAYYVDKILKGAKPSDLPVERPVTAKFVINLKAAEAIRIKIPPEVLQRADTVIK
jgi:putative tryptophan/tyrosine transport system substrate-binding protein